ncbi:MAG: M28 family metallopeptidase [Sphingomonas sp.]
MVAATGALAQAAPRVASSSGAPLPADQAAMRTHVAFLSSDAMQGREASSPEYMVAARYVATQFEAAGLAPAGTGNSYLQTVPLVAYRPQGTGDIVLRRRGAGPRRLIFGKDYVPGAPPGGPTTNVDAPVVFVGRGIVAPSYQRDDYAGVDVRGKIVAYFDGVPNTFQSEERAHFANPATKATVAADRGAIGVIVLRAYPLDDAIPLYDLPITTWANPDGTGHAAGAPLIATLGPGGAAKLFAGARQHWDDIGKAAGIDTAVFRAEQLPGSLAAALHTTFAPSSSANVAGLLRGSDPALGQEVVVLSAHLDHLGTGAADARGDTIYNGAEDNAVGIAALIEEARRFQRSGKPPRRSILFLAVTAEEKGLVGSDYFTHHATLPIGNIVADVNLDMPIITYRFEDVTVFGADRSTLGPIVSNAVKAFGVTVSPDPDPAQGLFVRSDHYRFVQQGIPSVFLWPGQAGAGKAAWVDFFAHRYHQPSDEIGPALDWAQGVRFVAINYAIAREIADKDARPKWNKGDFFGLLYRGYGAQ